MANQKNILIVGAGYGGVHVAKKLAKKYKKDDDVQITLIDKNPYHTLMTELHEVAGGRVHPESVQVNLRQIFHRTKVKVVTEYVKNIDVESQTVETDVKSYKYDYIVIGTGSEPSYFGVPGVKEHGFSLWSFEDAIKIRKHIEETFLKASLERDAKKRKEMLTFVVAGSGFTGIEMIGELVEWKKKLCKEYNIYEEDVRLMVVEALATILNMLDRKQADKAENYLIKNKVEMKKNSPIVEVTPNKIVLKSGEEIPTQTLIWTCGIQANSDAKEYGLTQARAGRVQTNEFMQSVEKPNVYVVGDIAYYEEEKGKGNPQIVEAAVQTGDVIAKNISADMEKGEKVSFKSNYHGFMVSVGGRYCVANLSGMKLSGFFAMVMKHMVNLHYLWGIGGITVIWRYLCHEFFNMEDRRSIMGGHLSSKANRLWLVPLRLYIGILWVLEALKKLIGEGTWEKAKGLKKLTSGIGDDSWIKSGNVKMPFEWLQLDGASGASQAADAAGGASYAQPILKSMPKFYEALMKIFIPNPDIAVWFQRIVVMTELAIGLCLIAGLFTWLASAASAFMVLNFVLSAMAGWEILWYFFGAIALMGGAGRTFGLDYYVMPWISKALGNWWLGKPAPVYSENKVS
ncbi:FAD-dependent oxidoreductase [Clostridium sp. MSJ-4]|uniref:NADH:ubiquinone reductase (non-electrogenic) n=1 Tax=Clostridium simiarum TaxID=2841506 RepID=A0ABS6EVL0_9CLOT|nr:MULTISPECIES: FAD-dependent oxidoreductase [Clostridium]MBU5590266.1 FAD-dependent oxidoreductase [Clostridium simiarum]